MQEIVIRKVADQFGWLGNMSPHPVKFGDVTFKTNEHLFQVMRYLHLEEQVKARRSGLRSVLKQISPERRLVIKAIREKASPMSAKFAAKNQKHRPWMVIEPMSSQDVDNMSLCLNLKLGHYPWMVEALLETGSLLIVEDCSRRPSRSGKFWGAVGKAGGPWFGRNMLGLLCMGKRSKVMFDPRYQQLLARAAGGE